MNMTDEQITQAANGMFLMMEGHRLNKMAQAVIDSKYLEEGGTFDELKSLFKERGLGENNVLNFLRYAESQLPNN